MQSPCHHWCKEKLSCVTTGRQGRAVMALDDRTSGGTEWECDILNLALWAAKGPVQTGSLGVMGFVVFGTAFVYHYDDHNTSMF